MSNNDRVLGLEHLDLTPNDRPAVADLFAHAAGGFCQKCDRPLEPLQPARRRGEFGWVHDVCPDL